MRWRTDTARVGNRYPLISASQEPPAPFKMLSTICAASVPTHLGRRIIFPSTRASRSASSTATVVVAGPLIDQSVTPHYSGLLELPSVHRREAYPGPLSAT